jgi:hypothetical protein
MKRRHEGLRLRGGEFGNGGVNREIGALTRIVAGHSCGCDGRTQRWINRIGIKI